jgi:hypothetical protein
MEHAVGEIGSGDGFDGGRGRLRILNVPGSGQECRLHADKKKPLLFAAALTLLSPVLCGSFFGHVCVPGLA